MRLEATGPLSNSEQVRRARFAATPTASPQGPAPITARSSINEPLSRHFDDLIAMRTHAHVLDGCVCKVLEPVQRVEWLAVAAVADAHRNLRERVEHVELGDGEAGEAVDAHCVADDDGVEPPTAARPARGGPELIPQLADPLGKRRRGLRR